ncbi:hypothetical protein DEO72_LG6g2014 [Vigna unguiculata]|uniref:Secreted protein n=1 Tax=Vigna unguiculata TaxID=3917 RepID=A0A4D6MC06_VIGUN|nr:hypothetical protein DEO72_LG6g2014 [Vigna unguiculata]
MEIALLLFWWTVNVSLAHECRHKNVGVGAMEAYSNGDGGAMAAMDVVMRFQIGVNVSDGSRSCVQVTSRSVLLCLCYSSRWRRRCRSAMVRHMRGGSRCSERTVVEVARSVDAKT